MMLTAIHFSLCLPYFFRVALPPTYYVRRNFATWLNFVI